MLGPKLCTADRSFATHWTVLDCSFVRRPDDDLVPEQVLQQPCSAEIQDVDHPCHHLAHKLCRVTGNGKVETVKSRLFPATLTFGDL